MSKKYALVTGTRPQIIKSVPIIREALKENTFDLVHIFTGQHYDAHLTDVFFEKLSVETPNYQLNIRSGSTDYHIRKILENLVPVLEKEQINGILVPGDTNSALAAALAGMSISIPVIHIESGLRSYDLKMQEEINRRLIDHSAALLFAPTKIAVSNLKKESVLGNVILSGDTMYDLLIREIDSIKNREIFDTNAQLYKISANNYIVLTIHRRENLNNIDNIKNILETVGKTEISTLFPIHPHTRKILLLSKILIPKNIHLIDPLPYSDFLNLVAFSGLVVTDSGGLQKEVFLLDIPCVTARNSTEWLETVEHNANIVVGANPVLLLQAIEDMYKKNLKNDKEVYGNGKASELIIRELIDNPPLIPSIPDL